MKTMVRIPTDIYLCVQLINVPNVYLRVSYCFEYYVTALSHHDRVHDKMLYYLPDTCQQSRGFVSFVIESLQLKFMRYIKTVCV